MASRWQDEFGEAWRYRSAIILCGNIRDLQAHGLDGGPLELLDLKKYLTRWAVRRVNSLMFYDPVDKFRWGLEPAQDGRREASSDSTRHLSGDFSAAPPNPDQAGSAAGLSNEIARIGEYLSEGGGDGNHRAAVVQFAEQVCSAHAGDEARQAALVQMEKLVNDISPGNHLVLVYLFADDIPPALHVFEPRATVIEIPSPDRGDVRSVLQFRYGVTDPQDLSRLLNVFHGLSLREINRIVEHLGGVSDPDAVERAVRVYKFGQETNPWAELDLERLESAPRFFKERIKGQDEAVEKVAKVLVRARADIRRTTGGNPSQPRGVLFFAGPTGVGKTLTAKRLGEFLFGEGSELLRFDMSEYKEEFQVSRLFGAPPGYVGHEQGGTLTSPLQSNPFRVILFDEFEKAGAQVFDVFLQILSDGRLTDSKGAVAHFSESIIIFTSNLGTDENWAPQLETICRDPGMASEEAREAAIRNHFIDAVEWFFQNKIGRPELLNRIGRDNIVVFGFVDDLKTAEEILRSMLADLEKAFNAGYALTKPKLRLELPIDVVASFLVRQNEQRISTFGGREVENLVNELVRDPLAMHVLNAEKQGRPSAMIRGLVDDDGFRLELVGE